MALISLLLLCVSLSSELLVEALALTLKNDPCLCLAWRSVLDSKDRTCFDLPGVCDAMKERGNQCSPFNFCWVSHQCGNSFRKHPIFGTNETGEINFRSCDGVSGVKLNAILSPLESKTMAAQFSNLYKKSEHVFTNASWYVDEETGLRNPGCPVSNIYGKYAKYDAKTLVAWEGILESRWNHGPMKKHMAKWWAKQQQSVPTKILFVSVGDAVDYYHFKQNFPDIAKNAEIYGCDISSSMLKLGMQALAASGSNMDLSHCDGQNLAFINDTFDVVWHVGSINSWPSPGKGLAEFQRVLKPGGIIGAIDENIQYDRADAAEAAGFKATCALLAGQKMLHTPIELLPSDATDIYSYNVDDFYYWLTFSK